MTYTERRVNAMFPYNMMMKYGDTKPVPPYTITRLEQHNNVIKSWAMDMRHGLSDAEVGILDLAMGINSWIKHNRGIASDGLFGPQVTVKLFEAFIQALDGAGRSRLDMGTFSDWALYMMRELGFNEDGDRI